jgi:cytosine/adenosine deaminase-related metal-dependent hydrolase
LTAGVGNVMHFAGVDLRTAIRMASDHPARLLGLEPGRLEPGAAADLVVFDLTPAPEEPAAPRMAVRTVLCGGQAVTSGQ